MNLTDAATTITEGIEEYATTYAAAKTDRDDNVILAFSETNRDLDTPLPDSALHILFARYGDAEEAADIAAGYRIRYGAGHPTEDTAQTAVHAYCADLTHHLREAGYTGEDYTVDHFTDL